MSGSLDEPKREYRLTTGTYITGGKTYNKGDDKLYLTDRKAKEMGDRVALVVRVAIPTTTTTTPTNPAPVTDVDWSKYRDMRAPDLIAEIRDTDSLDDLMELKKIEEGEGGQNRIGVLKEIDKRVKQLEGGE